MSATAMIPYPRTWQCFVCWFTQNGLHWVWFFPFHDSRIWKSFTQTRWKGLFGVTDLRHLTMSIGAEDSIYSMCNTCGGWFVALDGDIKKPERDFQKRSFRWTQHNPTFLTPLSVVKGSTILETISLHSVLLYRNWYGEWWCVYI